VNITVTLLLLWIYSVFKKIRVFPAKSISKEKNAKSNNQDSEDIGEQFEDLSLSSYRGSLTEQNKQRNQEILLFFALIIQLLVIETIFFIILTESLSGD
jgi:hypothetical protein